MKWRKLDWQSKSKIRFWLTITIQSSNIPWLYRAELKFLPKVWVKISIIINFQVLQTYWMRSYFKPHVSHLTCCDTFYLYVTVSSVKWALFPFVFDSLLMVLFVLPVERTPRPCSGTLMTASTCTHSTTMIPSMLWDSLLTGKCQFFV